MKTERDTDLSAEHQDFFERFKSFWAAPTGERVREIIAPDATIHFTGQGTFSGTDYIAVMTQILASMDALQVVPVDCAGNGERLYIYWTSSATIDGQRKHWLGVDRFRINNGIAIEEHVIFDPTFLLPQD